MAPAITDGELYRRVAELKAENVQPLAWTDLIEEKPESPLTDEQRAALSAYFAHFMATPTDADGKQVCPCCRKRMLSGVEGFLLGGSPDATSLEWSLAHGEARCAKCGWPYRVYHYDIGGKGDAAIIQRLNCALAVHPSGIEVPSEVTSHA